MMYGERGSVYKDIKIRRGVLNTHQDNSTKVFGAYEHSYTANVDFSGTAPSALLAMDPLGHGGEVRRWVAAGGPFTDGCRYSVTLGS